MTAAASMHPARAERAALAGLLDEVGPEAPTLCSGWTAYDLAAHLVTRDRNPAALPGLVVGPLHPLTERLEAATRRALPYAECVRLVRAGPPAWLPMGLPVLRDAVNAAEMLVHHEDVRRARPGWTARPPDPSAEPALWRALRVVARRGGAATLVWPDGATVRMGRGGPVVRGPVVELLLWASGRRAHALVETGPADPVSRPPTTAS